MNMNQLSEVKVDFEVENLIIGFGFSVIPLVRELEIGNKEYTILSDRNTVWSKLEKAGKLDFDLVSSYYTSFYSFDIADDKRNDFYPTAREFYSMHQRYFEKYKSKITKDFVEKVYNFKDYSLVFTKSKKVYKAKKCVITTGFKRKILSELSDFDYNIKDKTVVFNTIGDSTNLMISKLVPNNNKVVVLQNGFFALDKIMSLRKVTYTLDQLEFHNVGLLLRYLYVHLIVGSFGLHIHIKNFLLRLLSLDFLSKIFCPHTMHTKYNTGREFSVKPIKRAVPNGTIAIKYWPIDKYSEEFSDDLEGNIKKGYMLNDISYFVDKKYVELWSKEETKVDMDNKSIEWKGKKCDYDVYVEGDAEMPNLPPIFYDCETEEKEYEYVYKENYLGVIPTKLSNIFFLGYTRPITGGLANITEIQCLFAHKLLVNSDFHASIHSNLQERLDTYNKHYYTSKEVKKSDHLVFYGFFTEEVAKVIGINRSVWSCRSLSDLNKHFIFPNNAFKYRQEGEYKVEGVKGLVDFIYKNHNGYSEVNQYLFTFYFYILIFLEYSVLLFAESKIGLTGFLVSLVLQYVFVRVHMIGVQNYYGLFKLAYLGLGMVAMPFVGTKIMLPLLAFDFVFTFIKRQLGFRYFFNDLKFKKKYDGFFKKYLKAYRLVNG